MNPLESGCTHIGDYYYVDRGSVERGSWTLPLSSNIEDRGSGRTKMPKIDMKRIDLDKSKLSIAASSG